MRSSSNSTSPSATGWLGRTSTFSTLVPNNYVHPYLEVQGGFAIHEDQRYGIGTVIAAHFDEPVADKALLVTMYITLAAVHLLPDWLAIIVVFRDILIVGGVVVLTVLGQGVAIRPLYISKVNTVMQILLVAATLLQSGFGLGVPGLRVALIWCVAATTLASGAAYVWNTARGD